MTETGEERCGNMLFQLSPSSTTTGLWSASSWRCGGCCWPPLSLPSSTGADQSTTWAAHLAVNLFLTAVNGYMTWRIAKRLPITGRHAMIQGLLDLVTITVGLFLLDGFQNAFYVFYYPALLGYALIFPGRPAFLALGAVVTLYIVIAFTVSPTLDLDLKHEKPSQSGS